MLEIIQIQVQQSTGSAGLFRLIDLSRQIPLTAHTVIQSRQEIRVCLLFDATLVQLFIRNIIQGVQVGFFPVYPGDLLAQQIVPGLLLRMIYHADGSVFVLADTGLQQGIKIMIHQFLGKGILQYLVGEQHSARILIRYVDGTSHIVQDLLQCGVRTCQGIFLDPSGQDTL